MLDCHVYQPVAYTLLFRLRRLCLFHCPYVGLKPKRTSIRYFFAVRESHIPVHIRFGARITKPRKAWIDILMFRAVGNYGAGTIIAIITIPVTNMLGGTQSVHI